MVEFELDPYNREAERKLKALGDKRLKMERIVMTRIAQGMVSYTQKNKLAGQVLKRQSGNLAASMQFRLTSAHSFAIGPGMIYGKAHEFGIPLSDGNIIRPKTAKALRFVIGGQVIFRKSVRQHVPKRPFLEPAIREYLVSGEGEATAAQALQDWIDRL